MKIIALLSNRIGLLKITHTSKKNIEPFSVGNTWKTGLKFAQFLFFTPKNILKFYITVFLDEFNRHMYLFITRTNNLTCLLKNVFLFIFFFKLSSPLILKSILICISIVFQLVHVPSTFFVQTSATTLLGAELFVASFPLLIKTSAKNASINVQQVVWALLKRHTRGLDSVQFIVYRILHWESIYYTKVWSQPVSHYFAFKMCIFTFFAHL